MKALIIDDEPAIRETLQATLRSDGIEAETAGDGAAGLAALNDDIAVVLLDIKMPGRDGMEILTELHANRPDLPVIMISGHGTVETAVQATKTGAFDFLEKPLDRDVLLRRVRNALDLSRLNRENVRLRQRGACRQASRARPIAGRISR